MSRHVLVACVILSACSLLVKHAEARGFDLNEHPLSKWNLNEYPPSEQDFSDFFSSGLDLNRSPPQDDENTPSASEPSGSGPSGSGPPGSGPSGSGPPGSGPSGSGPSGSAPSGSGSVPPGLGPRPQFTNLIQIESVVNSMLSEAHYLDYFLNLEPSNVHAKNPTELANEIQIFIRKLDIMMDAVEKFAINNGRLRVSTVLKSANPTLIGLKNYFLRRTRR